MAHTKTLQFYRNLTVIRPDENNNKSALTVARETLNTYGSKNDGEITLVRYQEGNNDPVKTLVAIYRKNGSTGTWTYITEFDYDNYYTKEEINDNELVIAQALSDLASELDEKAYTLDLSAVALSGSYNDLLNKPTIPAGVIVDNTITQNSTNPVRSSAIYAALASKSDVSSTVTDISYSSSTKKIQKTINNSTTDVVTLSTVATSGLYGDLTGIPGVQECTDTGDASKALSPNIFYIFTNALNSLTLTLTSGTGLCIYAGKFTASNSWGGVGLNVPSTVTMALNNDTVSAGGVYEFSILDNVMILKQIA